MKVCIRSKVGKTGRRHWQILMFDVISLGSYHSFAKALEHLPRAYENAKFMKYAFETFDDREPSGRHVRGDNHFELVDLCLWDQLRNLPEGATWSYLPLMRTLFGGAVAST